LSLPAAFRYVLAACAQGLGLSRNEVLGRVKCDIPLHCPTSARFTLTVLAED
jgi:hypothetical protein